LDFAPASIVAEDQQIIAYYISQSSIYKLNKTEQEELQIADKQMLFYPGF
jgi:hypothetical protein